MVFMTNPAFRNRDKPDDTYISCQPTDKLGQIDKNPECNVLLSRNRFA